MLLNITAQGFVLIPQMFLHIISGNEERHFDTIVEAEKGKICTSVTLTHSLFCLDKSMEAIYMYRD